MSVAKTLENRPIISIIGVCCAVLGLVVPAIYWVDSLRIERVAAGCETKINKLQSDLAALNLTCSKEAVSQGVTENPSAEPKAQTCWRVRFGLNDLDWTTDLRVPSRAGCYAANIEHDSFDAVGLCDARFTGQKLRINMTKLTTFKDGERFESPVVNLEAEGTEEAEIISGMHLTYGHQRPWQASRIDCSQLIQ